MLTCPTCEDVLCPTCEDVLCPTCDVTSSDAADAFDLVTPVPEAAWTFIVYLNGDNNLEDDAWEDLHEMMQVGSQPGIEIIVLLDTLAGPTLRVRVLPGTFEIVGEVEELDLSDWQVLADFVVWAMDEYPAKRTALILWDHGDGWRTDGGDHAPVKAFSNDDSGDADEISIARGDYALAMEEILAAAGKPLDLIGFDACLMGMWEVATASATYGDFLVASEDTEPAHGWRYDQVLATLALGDEVTPTDLGVLIVETFFQDDEDNATLALVDLAAVGGLTEAMDALGTELLVHPDLYPLVDKIRAETEWFDEDEGDASAQRDLGDFAARLHASQEELPDALRDVAGLVADNVDTAVVLHKAQDYYPNAHGLAVYLPPASSPFDPDYQGPGAVWSQQTSWDEFLADFMTGTIPEAWDCKNKYYAASDGCDCDCGAWDPDCDDPDQEIWGCEDDEVCVPPGLCDAG